MQLVIDANVLISALISKGGKTYDLLFNNSMNLFSPEFLREEFEKYKSEILYKSKLSQSDFELFLALAFSRIRLVSKNEFKDYIKKAEKITPDPKDREYIALALRMDCDIWSNDKILKEQNDVKVHNTSELLKLI